MILNPIIYSSVKFPANKQIRFIIAATSRKKHDFLTSESSVLSSTKTTDETLPRNSVPTVIPLRTREQNTSRRFIHLHFWDLLGKNIFRYIEEVSHMDEVRVAQEKVIRIKDNLKGYGDKKRDIIRNLEGVRHDLQRVYSDIKYNDNKASERYLHLVKEEVDLYRREKLLQENFKNTDEEERLLFNEFSVAINDSYEKEKIHTNFIKVWGIVGTLLASFVTLVAAIIGHYHHQKKFATLALDFRQDVTRAIDNKVTKKLENLEKKLQEGFNRLQIQQQSIAISQHQRQPKTESWAHYLKRHTRWIYGWVLPK